MTGYTITIGYIKQTELRWVDAWDDVVSDSDGGIRPSGTWAIFLDTAKYIATTQVEAMMKSCRQAGFLDDADRHKRRLQEMRGEGKYDIEMKKDRR